MRESPPVRGIPSWTVVTAATAPILLIGGFSIAAALQPSSYDPVRDTISALAAQGATDPWIMTAALIGVGACYLLTALGLRAAHQLGRIALAGGGLGTLFIAVFRQPLHGYSVPHEAAVVMACATMCAWPILGARRNQQAPLLMPQASVSATAVTLGLVLWFAFEVRGGELGLAERLASVAIAMWLFPVAFTTRRAHTLAESEAMSLDEGDAGGSCSPGPSLLAEPMTRTGPEDAGSDRALPR